MRVLGGLLPLRGGGDGLGDGDGSLEGGASSELIIRPTLSRFSETHLPCSSSSDSGGTSSRVVVLAVMAAVA
jgi:hypothetical protein